MFDVWKSVLNDIEKSVSSSNFSTWFNGISLISMDEGKIVIGTPNVFFKRQLESKFFDTIKQSLLKNDVDVKSIEFEIVQANRKPKSKARTAINQQTAISLQKIQKRDLGDSTTFDTGLNNAYRLDNFVVGSNNDLAVSVAKNVINSPGKRYNPFFLYGGPGLGKTHLVQAIGNELHKKDPNLKILYTPTNHFYSDFVTSIKKGKTDEFYKKFQKLDVLIVDDFQMIIGKDASQEQFFNIFNDLYNLNKQIIVTCDRLPEQLENIDKRLTSRLAMAGAIDLQMPSFEDRCAILKSMAEFLGEYIEDETIEFIAENVKTNIRDLEKELKTILALSDLKGVSPLNLIEGGYISVVSRAGGTKTVSPKKIVDKVAKYYNLSTKELKSKSRVFHIKNARQIAMFLLSKELSMSTNKIAVEVGVGDHSTVMNGIKRIENNLKTDFSLRDQLEEIKGLIYE